MMGFMYANYILYANSLHANLVNSSKKETRHDISTPFQNQ